MKVDGIAGFVPLRLLLRLVLCLVLSLWLVVGRAVLLRIPMLLEHAVADHRSRPDNK